MRKSSNQRRFIGGIFIMIVLIGAMGAGLLHRPPDPFRADAVTDPPFKPLRYGVQTFLWWDGGHASTQLEWVEHLLSFTHIKQTFPWRDMELRPGQWNFSEADRIVEETRRRDIKLIVRLGQTPAWAVDSVDTNDDTSSYISNEKHDAPPTNLDDWRGYCRTVAERYAGRIQAYQIWNEPNLSREWGDDEPNAAEYVDLLAACSEAIRTADPDAIIISAGLAPTGRYDNLAHPDDVYLDAMYRANFQQYVDVVGVHAPGYGQPPRYGPDDAAADGKHRSNSFRRIEDLRKIMIQHDDAARQMAVLEFGWTTDTQNPDYAWHAVDEATQADYIVDAYTYAYENWRPWVGLMSLIYLPNPEWTDADEEAWWAIVEPNGRPRPVFFDLASMDRYCGDTIVDGWPENVAEEVFSEQRITCP